MKDKGIIAVVSGFSGAGKGTLMKALVQKYDCYALSVSATTRDPRPGEVNGKDYFYLSDDEFEKMIEENGLIEHAGYCHHYYGTPRKFVEEQLEAGKDVLLEIEVQGAMQIRKQYPDAVLLFVTPPSAAELEKRLRGRGTETEEVIKERLFRAREEATYMDQYDYLVVNDKLEECVEELHSTIRTAHNTPSHKQELVENMKQQLLSI